MTTNKTITTILLMLIAVNIAIAQEVITTTQYSDFSEWQGDALLGSADIQANQDYNKFSSPLLRTNGKTIRSIKWGESTPIDARTQIRFFENHLVEVNQSDPFLVDYWPLTSGYNGVNKHNLNVGDTILNSTGLFIGEKAPFFSGSDHLEDNHNNSYRLGDNWTLQLWMQINSSATCGSDRCQLIDTRFDTQATGYSLQYREVNSLLRLTWGQTSGFNETETRVHNLSDGAWHFVAVTFNNHTDTIRFFVDGWMINETIHPGLNAPIDQTAKFIIGEYQSETGFGMHGKIAHVAVFKRDKRVDELTNNYYGEFTGNGIPIIYTHDIRAGETGIHTTEARFRDLIGWLYNMSYTSVSVEQIAQWMNGTIELPARSFNLQFDDGFSGVYSIAYPILESYGYTATIAPLTGEMNTSSAAADRLNYSHYTILANAGWEIASHTHNHSALATHTDAVITQQINVSHYHILHNISIAPKVLITPECSIDKEVSDVCKALGYIVCTATCNVGGNYNHSNYDKNATWQLQRIPATMDSDYEQVKQTILGYHLRGLSSPGIDERNWYLNQSKSNRIGYNSIQNGQSHPSYYQIQGLIHGASGEKIEDITIIEGPTSGNHPIMEYVIGNFSFIFCKFGVIFSFTIGTLAIVLPVTPNIARCPAI
jgi:peptidoglycan/xylan/chitin deacetylase (PgdA/CDA1 family)